MSKRQGKLNKKTTDNQGYFGPDISGVQKSEDYLKRKEAEEAIDKEHVTKWQRFLAFSRMASSG